MKYKDISNVQETRSIYYQNIDPNDFSVSEEISEHQLKKVLIMWVNLNKDEYTKQ